MLKDPHELIRPAVEGTQRAIGSAIGAGHKRFVLTSSLAAIDAGHPRNKRHFMEHDWSDFDGADVSAYIRSRTLAEKTAWDLTAKADRRDELVVINPSTMVGALLDDDPGTSTAILLSMLRDELPMVSPVRLEYADVRDVAAAHVAALSASDAGGRRHIFSGDNLSLFEVARIIEAEFPQFSKSLPRREMPAWLVKALRTFSNSLRDARQFIGEPKTSDGARGNRLLGKAPIPARDAIIATIRSMIARNMI